MSEPARQVRLLSPEEVRAILDEHDRRAGMADDCEAQRHSPDDPYLAMVVEREELLVRLCWTLLDAWGRSDRLERENAELKVRLSK